MGTKGSADVGFLLIGGRSVLGAPLTEIGELYERVLEQNDGLSDKDDEWGDVGQAKFELSQTGFYNQSVGSLHEALETADPQVLLYGPVGNAVGDDLVAISGVRTTYDRLPARGTFHKARALYRAAEGPEGWGRSVVSIPHAARTDLGPTLGAIHDFLASTASGGAIYLAVSALTLDGGTDLAVSIRHSTDNFVANDVELAAFTGVAAAPASQRVVVVGTINRYTRTRYVFNGASGTNRSATFVTGLGRK